MKNPGRVVFFGIALLLELTACQNRPFPTEAIYEDQSLFVRLAVDQTIGGGHSHPASLTTEEMTAVLSGLMIEEPGSLIPSVPLPGKDKESPRHPAFRTEEIASLAPLLARGLNTARPEEVVTFYWITQQPAPIEHVTSGGVFINDGHLHFLLSNYRSPTRYPPDAETMQSLDGRSTPLQSLVPQDTLLTFDPITALVPPEQGFFKNPFRSKRQEIVVLFKKLAADSVR
ncbi:MAG: hypothetical protein HC938_15610 [Nitrospira sp.]|nr:hypothetical protein [Nitrospira sp.]